MSDDLCPYCSGVKRIRDDFIHGTHRYIIEIKNGNELWSIEFTVGEIRINYIEQNKRYLWLKNGGCVNLDYMVRLAPYIVKKSANK